MNFTSPFNIKTPSDFEIAALALFKFQAKNNTIYRTFLDHLNFNYQTVSSLNAIPFLPIQFFKTHRILSVDKPIQETFLSSGTTGMQQSKHLVTDLSLYKTSYLNGFQYFYSDITDYTVLALLPSYLDRNGSSLIYMVSDLIKKSGSPKSGFYLNNLDALASTLIDCDQKGKKVLLIGVSFALLDLIDKHTFQLKNTIIMETGGMKGRRKELIRAELHQQLCQGFGVEKIHSEYGMTELLSQAYSKENGLFNTPPWMTVSIRDTEDALSILPNGQAGGINVIDLANRNSCAFIATQDLGKIHQNGSFEILGRFDNSDIRGCNLMVV